MTTSNSPNKPLTQRGYSHSNEADTLVLGAYRGERNPITNMLVASFFTRDKRYAVELSRGKFLSKLLFGVSVVSVATKGPIHELSKAFGSLKEALDYIEEKLEDQKEDEEV